MCNCAPTADEDSTDGVNRVITLEERNRVLQTIADQHRELFLQSEAGVSILLATVTCPCGRRRGITHAVRCLYCDVWFCELCAEVHFGKTRRQHRLENPIEDAEPDTQADNQEIPSHAAGS